MENGFIYLIKASGLIGLFYFAYFLLLRKETFFSGNRWFLLLGLITSSVLPLFFITKIIWVEPTTDSFDWSNIPVTTSVATPEPEIDWFLILTYAYLIGIAISFFKLVFDFNSLIQLLKGKTIQLQGNFKLIDSAENIAPFSYFNYIVYNSSLYTAVELENILEHEKVHSQQKHSIDVLISSLFCVVFWFNPLIWLYKKAIAQNLEFIADREAAKKISDKKAYQFTLLKITTQENCVALTNHFYQSLIKKRIIMLNQNQSEKWNSWKYFTVFPALVAFVFLFQIEVVAQEKETPKQETETKSKSIDFKSFEVDKDLISLSKEKEVIIDGKQSSKEDLDKLNPNDIEKIDVATISGKKTILVTKKTKKDNKDISPKPYDVVYIDGEKISQSELENNFVFRNVEDVKIVEGKTNKTYYVTTSKKNKEKLTELTTKNEKPVIVLNGSLNNSLKIEDIDPDKIESINVLKGNQATFKYGENGKNGILEITTKEKIGKNEFQSLQGKTVQGFELKKDKTVNGWKVESGSMTSTPKEVNGWKVEAEPIKQGIKQDVATINNVDYNKVVIIIDEKISNSKKFKKLNPDQIVSITIRKTAEASQKNKDDAVQKYGEKALNGIIEVVTKPLFK